MTLALRQRPLARIVAGIVRANDGALFDPSDLSTLYQDAAGTIPVTAVEQPVGLMLDKSRGLMLGPELVSNGTFDSDTGWTKSGTWAISGGVASATTESGTTYQNAGLQAGKCYKFTFEIKSASAGVFAVGVGGNTISYWKSSVGVYTGFGYTNGNPNIELKCSGFTGIIDNISVRELYGYHATQPITASRPTLSARYNLLTKTDPDAGIPTGWTVGFGTGTYLHSLVDGFGPVPAGHKAIKHEQTVSGRSYLYYRPTVPAATPVAVSIYVDISRSSITSGSAAVLSLIGSVTVTKALSDAVPLYPGSSIGMITASGTSNDTLTEVRIGVGVVLASVGVVYFTAPDFRIGTAPGPYQRVNTATDYDTDERYFKKYLRFDGVDDYLNLPYMGLYANGSASVVMAKSADYQIDSPPFLVETSSISTTPTYQLLGGLSQPYGLGVHIRNNAGTTNVNTKAVLAMDAQSTAHIVTIIDSGALIKRFNNSSIADSDAYTRSNPLTVDRTVIGAFYSGASIYNKAVMNLYGLIITKSALTDAQRVRCERHAGRKAGVQL